MKGGGHPQSVLGMLLNACTPRNLELYFNNTRMRTWFVPKQAAALPFGTTSNEQRHFVFNSTWRVRVRASISFIERTLLVLVVSHMGVAARRTPYPQALTWQGKARAWAARFQLFNNESWNAFLRTAIITRTHVRPGRKKTAKVTRKKGSRLPASDEPGWIPRDTDGYDRFLRVVSMDRALRPR